ncbi:hypothetical protein [Dyella sp. A6]|nr:hypothetical protein [Dyella sp. A6]
MKRVSAAENGVDGTLDMCSLTSKVMIGSRQGRMDRHGDPGWP